MDVSESKGNNLEAVRGDILDDFALFILSNGRPDEQLTLSKWLEYGYTGDWYILCDNLDDTLDRYIELYGDNVIVFDKDEWREKTDTYDNVRSYGSVVYARNAALEIGRSMGYKYIGQFDDDHLNYVIRHIEGDKLRTAQIGKNMDKVVESFLEYLENTPIDVLSFGYGATYVGGANGSFRKGLGTLLYSTFFIKTDAELEFRGLHNEDYILVSHYAKRGRAMFDVHDIQMTTLPRRSNDGGLKDLYDDSSQYEVAFYGVLESPDSTTVIAEEFGDCRISQLQKKRVVKVVSDKYRKEG